MKKFNYQTKVFFVTFLLLMSAVSGMEKGTTTETEEKKSSSLEIIKDDALHMIMCYLGPECITNQLIFANKYVRKKILSRLPYYFANITYLPLLDLSCVYFTGIYEKYELSKALKTLIFDDENNLHAESPWPLFDKIHERELSKISLCPDYSYGFHFNCIFGTVEASSYHLIHLYANNFIKRWYNFANHSIITLRREIELGTLSVSEDKIPAEFKLAIFNRFYIAPKLFIRFTICDIRDLSINNDQKELMILFGGYWNDNIINIRITYNNDGCRVHFEYEVCEGEYDGEITSTDIMMVVDKKKE